MQGCTLPPAGVAFQRMRPGTVWRAILKPTPQFEATNIFYRREALEAVGGFDESMSTWGEDSDLGWKVVESSWERGFCPRAVAIHDVEQRGWRHNVRFAWLDGNLVRVAARHPGYRKELFWRPWAVHRSSVELLLALAGLIAARWRRVALVAVLPYLLSVRARASSHGQAPTPGLLMETVVVDVTRCAAHLSASATNRVLVL
jgi:GT2 family glycosyltransferase